MSGGEAGPHPEEICQYALYYDPVNGHSPTTTNCGMFFIVKLSDNSCEVSAELSISDFLERWELDENAIETERHSVGGWIMELLDRIPEEGERIFSPPFEMEIHMQDEQKIGRVKITFTEEK